MTRKLIEHFLSIVLVGSFFVALIIYFQEGETARQPTIVRPIQEYLQLPFVDFDDPLDRALFKETLNAYYPDSLSRNDSIMQTIADARREQFANERYKTGGEERGITQTKLLKLFGMYAQFIAIYIVVMGLSCYGAQTLGVMWFVNMKRGNSSYIAELMSMMNASHRRQLSPGGARLFVRAVALLAKALAKGIALAVLFSPAYVIAYSIKTRFDTDSYLFMILLGVLSNGMLINYANKFYTFLVAESRRGYVDTAIVKNLNNSYSRHTPDGIPLRLVFQLKKSFPAHVFQHIYLNAHHQYLATLKEQASFLITGLVIIEMALNIQGHMSYEMLKNILYKQYDVVLSILLALFLLIKATEIAVDMLLEREARKYENRG